MAPKHNISDDEALARALQAQFYAEDVAPATRSKRTHNSNEIATAAITEKMKTTSIQPKVPEAKDIEKLSQSLARGSCTFCKKKLFASQRDIVPYYRVLGDGEARETKTVCPYCRQYNSMTKLGAIWGLLCGFDAEMEEKRMRHNKVVAPKGTRTGTGFESYGLMDILSMGPPAHTPSSNERRVDGKEDVTIAKAMNASSVLLKGCDDGRLSGLLLGNSMLDCAAELLRGSLADVFDRQGLYQALLRLVRNLADNKHTRSLVIDRRPARGDGASLMKISFGQGGLGSKKQEKEMPSLLKSMEELATQSRAYLKNDKTSSSTENQTIRAISILYTSLGGHTTTRTSSSTIPSVSDLPDNLITRTHSLLPPAPFPSPPGRLPRITRDLCTLRTSLPPGIYLRHGTTRPDIMKILILGPTETPYAHGLFEFDLFLPPQYPSVPPQMSFRTTGHGTVDFNPNLYPDGKVCLSLLGTWAGEPWNPKTSSLLQVLVSIQAMIFCEQPWFNEPGRGEARTASAMEKQLSAAYNRKIAALTVRWGMLEWLEKGRGGIWEDVVRGHFGAKGREILDQVGRWSRRDLCGGLREGEKVELSVVAQKLRSVLPALNSAAMQGGFGPAVMPGSGFPGVGMGMGMGMGGLPGWGGMYY